MNVTQRKAMQMLRRMTGRGRESDPIHLIAKSGLFDLEYYLAQTAGRSDAPHDLAGAVDFHIARGRELGLSFHPFFEPEWWDGSGSADLREQERYFIAGELSGVSTSPLIADVDGPIGPSCAYVQDVVAGRRGVTLPAGWDVARARRELVAAVRRMTRNPPNDGPRSGVNWRVLQDGVPGRTQGRVSVLVPTYQDWRMTVDAVRAALDTGRSDDIEVIVVDNGSRLSVSRLLAAVFLSDSRVEIIRASENTNFAGGMNIALAKSSGEFVLLLNNDAILADGWLPLLRAPLDASSHVLGSQPLLVYPGTGRVQAAGTIFLGEGVLPWHFLAGHPVADAERIRETRFVAVTAAVMMLRARDLIRAHGFDEIFANGYEDVDLCLRLRESGDDHFVLVTAARAEHPEGSSPGRSAHDTANRVTFLERWRGMMPAPETARYEALGIEMVGLRPLAYFKEAGITLADPHLVRRDAWVEEGAAAGLRSLRWSVVADISSSAVLREFEATRRVLRACGQEVVGPVSGVSASDVLDDVVISLGDRIAGAPRAGAFNVRLGEADEDGATWDYRTLELTVDEVSRVVERAVRARTARFGPSRGIFAAPGDAVADDSSGRAGDDATRRENAIADERTGAHDAVHRD